MPVASSTACCKLIFFDFLAMCRALTLVTRIQVITTAVRFNGRCACSSLRTPAGFFSAAQVAWCAIHLSAHRFIAVSDATDSYFEFVVFGPNPETNREFLV
jgi:hypothetical protein